MGVIPGTGDGELNLPFAGGWGYKKIPTIHSVPWKNEFHTPPKSVGPKNMGWVSKKILIGPHKILVSSCENIGEMQKQRKEAMKKGSNQ